MFSRLAAIVMLSGLGACTYGSEVDMAPHSARPWTSPVQPGRYCPVELSGGSPMVLSGDDCGFVEWNGGDRTIALLEPPSEDEPGEAQSAAIASLGGGLFVIQEEDVNDTPRYSILTALVRKDGFAAINTIGVKPYAALAKRHPRVVFAASGDGSPYVASGKRADIGALLRDASALSLKWSLAEGEDLDILVREEGGAEEPHPPTPAQTRIIADLQQRARALALRAPKGIDPAPNESPGNAFE